MALVIAVTQSCGLCFSTKQLRSAIIFQAKRGYRNVLGRNMRFSNFLLSKVSRICYRSKHKYAEKLMVEVVSYDSKSLLDRSKLFNKVPVLMGYNSLNDLIENGGGKKQSAMNQTDAMDDFDVSMACKRFPSIILGHSPPVELYDETKCSSEMSNLLAAQSAFLRNSMVENWDIDVDSFSEAWSSLCPASPNVISSIVGEENSINLPLSSQSMTLKIEENFNIPIIEDESSYSKPEVPPSSAPFELWLERCISCVPGLSKRLRGQMENCGFHTLRKLLHHFPRTYADVQNAHIDIEDGQYFIFVGNVLSSRGMRAGCSFSFLEVIVGCEVEDNKITSEDMDNDLVVARNRKKKIYLHLKRFFRGTRFTSIPFLRSIEGKHKVGEFVCVTGKMKTMQSKDHYEMREYNIDVLKEDDLSLLEKGRPYPIYPSKGGLNPDILRQTIASALNVLPVTFDPIPKEITQKFKLLSLYEAYIGIHQPKHIDEADLARKRLIFDEFFYLQGDVGCGKTVVAFLACMEVIGSGYQAAFMVPTELLAIQHYEHFLNLLEIMVQDDCKPSIALLTGSTPLKQSRMIRKDLQTGDISLVIGTHSLIAESVEFCALRLAIVDEQQRFGVIQRGRFNSKLYNTYTSSSTETENSDGSSKGDGNMAPHILAMSATPIPRTLALALYGDMSLTQITDLPPGRKPVKTYIIEGNDNGFEDVYKMMLYELESGGKVYLVYPVIKQSEQLPQLRAASVELETVSSRFKKFSCGLLHGRMKSDEKDEALRRFRSGETHILLSTQVIEIGVDVPDASMMVVMNAERFGMAQLHQLRGRVGRGERESKCILVASSTNSLKRLQVLEKSSDGFYLANMDLLQRGPGDLLGKKQSGHLPEFPIARLEIDGNILQDAHLAALKILSDSHDLKRFPALKAELSMRQPLSLFGD
ncbi:ATP-dependent DNA helicase homolog RECG, chloroplastic isoform X3 [Mangifera indica]|uniref:ATP-dependent DNA helicase homolog RECG, chloroplastic isoform X3 n=1 Tax=Mangifera indica TaxID=29780 RepID=UPI001CF95D79|nr:ATP-dependent DNA helicase homolog RECG, chloroplastic isoform X3 [Mangifera indica]